MGDIRSALRKRPPLVEGGADYGINLRDLRRAIALAEHRSFRRAAMALGLDQATLTRAVTALEHGARIRIFERSRKGAQVMEEGAEFLTIAAGVLAGMDHAMTRLRLRHRGEAGTLRLGVQTSFAAGPIAGLLAHYETACPEAELQLTDDTRDALLSDLAAARLDAAIVASGQGGWPGARAILGRERLLVAMAVDHPLAGGEVVTWEALAGCVFLVARKGAGAETLHLLARHGIGLDRIALHDAAIDRLLAMLRWRERVMIVTRGVTGLMVEGITYRPLLADGEAEALRYTLFWRGHEESPVVSRFVELARGYDWGGASPPGA
ncbi:MAG: LysR family transcriptional regulator [Gluconacetobacter sp.]